MLRALIYICLLFQLNAPAAADSCATSFVAVQKIVQATIGESIEDGTIFKEITDSGTPLLLRLRSVSGVVKVGLIKTRADQGAGDYTPEICGNGKTLILSLNGQTIQITKVGNVLRTNPLPFYGQLTFGAGATR